MSKNFRPWNIDQTLLLPPNVQDFVPKGHVSRFIVELVRESLDLKEIMGSYVSGLGQPPFDPRMMVALLLHGYASGLYSSRRIAQACRERNDFVMIVALDPPDFRTISDFRKRHLKALGGLFLQVLKLCEAAGLVKLGHVALDGTKIKANASKHKAMSYERMKKREGELKAEVARMLAAAEAADAAEDETFGKDKRGDELPDWTGDKQKRLAKIQQAMAALEAEARQAAEEERRIEAEKERQRQAEGRKKPGKPAAPPSEEPKALPGTQLTRRLAKEGRLHEGHDLMKVEQAGDQCTLGCNFDTKRPLRDILVDYKAVLGHVFNPTAYAGRLSRLAVMLDRSDRRRDLPDGDMRKRLGGIDSVHGIMRALPEVREPFWKTFVEVAKTNPAALRYIVMLMALYMHLGPFSKRVISEIDRRIAELDSMHPVRATESSARARSLDATGNNHLSNEQVSAVNS
jgi:transposase